MARFDIANDRTELSFDADEGGRIAQVVFRGVPLLIDREGATDPVLGWGCYPMVPWAGRLAEGRFQFRRDVVKMAPNMGPHAIHGLGFLHPWSVVAQSTSSLVARLDLASAGWPYSSWSEQRISLGPDFVHLEMSVHSSEREFPAQVGWHPWFRRPASLAVSFDSMFVRDDNHLTTTTIVSPTEGPWDDCFTGLRDGPRLTIDDVTITLTSSCDDWVVYTEPEHGLCVEPQSGPPNAFNSRKESGLDIVGPARVLQHSFTWRFSAELHNA